MMFFLLLQSLCEIEECFDLIKQTLTFRTMFLLRKRAPIWSRRFESSRADQNSLTKPTSYGWFFYAKNMGMVKQWQNDSNTPVKFLKLNTQSLRRYRNTSISDYLVNLDSLTGAHRFSLFLNTFSLTRYGSHLYVINYTPLTII